MQSAVSIATKGTLSCATPATKGFAVVCVLETPLRRRRGAPGVEGYENKRKLVQIFYNYEGVLYEFKQIVNANVKISASGFDCEILESETPKVTFKMIDD